MEVPVLLALSLVSGGAVLLLLRRLDRSRLTEAGTVFLLVFIGVGALSVLPGFLFYGLADALLPPAQAGRWGRIVFTWTVNAPVEELAKYLSFALAATLLGSLKRPRDGILQGASTGLGFALVENFLYGLSGGWDLLVLRSLVSLPGHVVYGAVWGGYHGFEAARGKGRGRWWVPALALVPAAFAHALFNTLELVGASLPVALAGDLLTLGFGVFLFVQLRD